jgi:DNA polymerase-3 subunit alpha
MKDFVHLHVHSEYSLLDGAIKLKDLFERAKELDYKAIALTDHGNMFGALEFYKLAKEYQIKPIIGMEVYIAEDSRFKKESQESIFHGILLAKNTTGYKNLLKLASLAYIEGFYYKPRIDLELLKKYHEGIIYLSGCLKSQIAYFILNHQKDKIRRKLLELKDIYGEDFYLELLNHGLEEEEKVNKTLLEFSSLYDIKVVATNDVHYINKEHAFSHDILLCIQTNKTYKQKDRLKFPNSEFYLKSKKQMINLFQDIPQSIENTIKISESCCVDIELGKVHLPIYNKDSPMLLRKLALDGAKKRFKNISTNIRQRLDYELSVIEKMGFCDYFLIVYDIVKYAKDNHIPVGPGRGSAAGSLIAYCLGITNINPIEYNLLFERFLNPERITLPDIDIDFADDKRNEIISYIRKKYGNDKVANIITFGTMQARAVVRDVGRAFGLAYSEVDRIAKAIWDSKLSLSDIERDSNFQRLIDSPEKKKLIE